jgi:hypothetical protein
VSDTGSNDPYDPNRPPPPPEQPQPPQEQQWGSPAPGQQPGYGQQPAYGSQPFGQPASSPSSYGQASYGQSTGSAPQNYLVWAVLATLFCCPPLGIPSIYFAAKVNERYNFGDLAGAQEVSRKAKQYALWATIAGGVIVVGYILLWVLIIGAASTA